LKKKVNLDVLDAKRAEGRQKRSAKKAKEFRDRSKIGTPFIQPEKLIMRERKRSRNAVRTSRIRASREPKKKTNPANLKSNDLEVLLVVRVRGHNGLTTQLSKIFAMLGLPSINTARVLRMTRSTGRMFKIIEPYITWGYPSLKSISDLIYKRGRLREGEKRVPITDNLLIEKHLGHLGIICVEDLVHELHKGGQHLNAINKELCSFKLNPPLGKFRNKRVTFEKGGDVGFRGEKIDELIQKMV